MVGAHLEVVLIVMLLFFSCRQLMSMYKKESQCCSLFCFRRCAMEQSDHTLCLLALQLSLEWARPRLSYSCEHACQRPFDYHTRKQHCWCCGRVFCGACVEPRRSVPNSFLDSLHQRSALICTSCRKSLQQQQSACAT